VRWIWLLFIAGLVAAKPVGCNLGEFEYLVRTIHNPTERHETALLWLKKYGASCTDEQLLWLWNNTPDLMGTADTPEWRYRLSQATERK
jgi:hypothetical protein